MLNVQGNVNSKRSAMWLNANSTNVTSALSVMIYRLAALFISTIFVSRSSLPGIVWIGAMQVSFGSVGYLLQKSPKHLTSPPPRASKSQHVYDLDRIITKAL